MTPQGTADATLPVPADTDRAVHGARWVITAALVVGALNYGYALVLTRLLDVKAYASFAAGRGLVLGAATVASPCPLSGPDGPPPSPLDRRGKPGKDVRIHRKSDPLENASSLRERMTMISVQVSRSRTPSVPHPLRRATDWPLAGPGRRCPVRQAAGRRGAHPARRASDRLAFPADVHCAAARRPRRAPRRRRARAASSRTSRGRRTDDADSGSGCPANRYVWPRRSRCRSGRRPDDWKRRGDTFPLLPHGCDEKTKIPPTRPASRTDVLTGGGEDTP